MLTFEENQQLVRDTVKNSRKPTYDKFKQEVFELIETYDFYGKFFKSLEEGYHGIEFINDPILPELFKYDQEFGGLFYKKIYDRLNNLNLVTSSPQEFFIGPSSCEKNLCVLQFHEPGSVFSIRLILNQPYYPDNIVLIRHKPLQK